MLVNGALTGVSRRPSTTARNKILPLLATAVALTLQAPSAASVNTQEWLNTSAATVASVDKDGKGTFASLSIGSLSGVLKASAGAVSGSATTSDLPEGSNLYYTDARARVAVSGTANRIAYNSATGVFDISSAYLANPTAQVGLTAVNGTATTAMRSDGAPALDVGISPTWTGTHTFSNTITGSISGTASTVTTNANLTGPITSVGNATSIASQSGTGTTFVMAASPTLTGTLTGVNATFSGTFNATGLSSIGGTSVTGAALNIQNDALTGVTQYGILSQCAFTSAATTQAIAGGFALTTAAGSYTVATGRGIRILTPTIGAGSTVTTLVGLDIENQTGGGTNLAIRTGTGGSVQFRVLTASQAVFTDASKNLVSNAITGTGSVVMSDGATLSGTVLGTFTFGGTVTFSNTVTGSVSGNAATATALQTARTINGTSFDGTANITVTAAAGTLTGTTLNATVVTSSLTAVGTITSGTWTGTAIAIANGGTGQTSKSAAFDALSPMTTLGDMIYGGASGTGTRLAGNITSTISVLTQTGTGSVSAAPVWTAATGTGSPVFSASPTLTGTLTAAAGTYSSTLTVTGAARFNGNIGVNIAVDAGIGVNVRGTSLTGTGQYGFVSAFTGSSAATTEIWSVWTAAKTAAAAFTCTAMGGWNIQTPTIGAGSTVTTLYGIKIENQTGGGTNYALFTGTGTVSFGDLLLTIASATGTAGFRLPHGAAPTSPVNGDMWTTTAGLFVRINGTTKTVTLT